MPMKEKARRERGLDVGPAGSVGQEVGDGGVDRVGDRGVPGDEHRRAPSDPSAPRTRDIGGRASTVEAGKAIAAAI